jgi:hypothetical protein
MTTEEPPEPTPLERLTAAVQAYVNDMSEVPRVVRGAVVAWEAMRYDEDGDDAYQVSYACTVGTSPSAAVGIFDLGRVVMLSHVVPAFTGDEDD